MVARGRLRTRWRVARSLLLAPRFAIPAPETASSWESHRSAVSWTVTGVAHCHTAQVEDQPRGRACVLPDTRRGNSLLILRRRIFPFKIENMTFEAICLIFPHNWPKPNICLRPCRNGAVIAFDTIFSTYRWVDSEHSAEISCPGWVGAYFLDIWRVNKQVFLVINKLQATVLSFSLAVFLLLPPSQLSVPDR